MNMFYNQKWIIFAVLLGFQILNAQETASKKITKKAAFSNNGELSINSKYGDIAITGWEKDSIVITATITVTQKKAENAKEFLGRINADVKIFGNIATINSEISPKNENLISKYFSATDVLNLDKSNVQINYIIYLPQNASLDVTNKFGDVFIENFKGRLTTSIEHGNMQINQNLLNATLSVKYGKLKTKAISYANISLKNATFELESSKNMNLNSSGSTINAVQITSLELGSNKDKISISNLGKIRGTASFSDLKLNTVDDEVNLTLKVTGLNISKMTNPDPYVSIEQQSSDMTINITGLSFKFYAYLEEGILRIPKSVQNLKSNMISKEDKLREINATYGKKPVGKISVTGKKGNIQLIDNNL